VAVGAASAWDRPDIVAGFARSAPNQQLIDYAHRHRRPWSSTVVLDIGCGAGRNAVPLAAAGFDVIGIDRSAPMVAAAAARETGGRLTIIEATMDRLPIRSRSIDLIVAHGIWNLARSDAEFHAALKEAARIAVPGAAAFVFTFSRHTLSLNAVPVAGASLTFTDFSGQPQIFLTLVQLLDEMAAVGFELDPELMFRELNLPPVGQSRIGGAPVIFEAAFRFRG
jgi:SAM-dependent methyltransferase